MTGKFNKLLLMSAGVTLGLALSIGSGVFAQKEVAQETLPWDDARLLAEVLERVRQEYVEPVEDSDLIESAVRGMVTDLDPHSQFLDSDEYEEVQISTSGNYSGVGLEVHLNEGTVRVVAAIEGTPAEQAGLRSGDVIVSIDNTILDESNFDEAVNHLRGQAGTQVKIAVQREELAILAKPHGKIRARLCRSCTSKVATVCADLSLICAITRAGCWMPRLTYLMAFLILD